MGPARVQPDRSPELELGLRYPDCVDVAHPDDAEQVVGLGHLQLPTAISGLGLGLGMGIDEAKQQARGHEVAHEAVALIHDIAVRQPRPHQRAGAVERRLARQNRRELVDVVHPGLQAAREVTRHVLSLGERAQRARARASRGSRRSGSRADSRRPRAAPACGRRRETSPPRRRARDRSGTSPRRADRSRARTAATDRRLRAGGRRAESRARPGGAHGTQRSCAWPRARRSEPPRADPTGSGARRPRRASGPHHL